MNINIARITKLLNLLKPETLILLNYEKSIVLVALLLVESPLLAHKLKMS
jgi:hypothetical protein